MKVNRDNILDALNLIRDVCNAQGTEDGCCRFCPFGDGTGDCVLLTIAPCSWEIKSKENDWKAFEV